MPNLVVLRPIWIVLLYIQENSPNWGALELRYLGMAGVADPKMQALTPHILILRG